VNFTIECLEPRQLLTGAGGVGSVYTPPADPRASFDLSPSWKFLRSDATGAANPGFDDSSWSNVSIPHSWNTLDGQDGGSNYYRGIGWYRKSIDVPAAFAGDTIYIQFQGSSLVTDLYIDGNLIGEHRGAFGAFNFDVTAALTAGGSHHLLAVKVDNSASWASSVPPQSGDFNVNGGIYRKLSLIGVTPAGHITVSDYASSGVYFSSPIVSSTSASIQMRTGLLDSSTTSSSSVNVITNLVDASGTIVAQMQTAQSLTAGQSASVTQNTTVTNPHLWNGRIDPYLYDLYVEVRDASTNNLLDLMHQQVGIRTYAISPTQGFLLNGQPYDLHGVNMHQDRLNEAWAISDDDIRQDISLVLEIGATMVRTAHYEQSQLTYDLADQYGLVIWAEVPDVGSSNGGAIPTGSAFASNAQDQLRELIRQNYNHPSIIVWSVYNEVTDNSANDAFVSTLNNLAHSEDPTRPTVGASWNTTAGTLEKTTDAVAYNRYYGWYYGVPSDLAGVLDSIHSANPTTPIGMSEYGAGAGITQHQESPTTVTSQALFHPEEYQSYVHEQTWPILASRPWLWTKLIWNMFDFAVDARNEGDTPGRNDKGLVTYDRKTKKDAFYYYKANWSSDPVLYITSRRWTERSDAVTSIKVYSNMDGTPTVTINGVSQGALVNQGYHVWLLSNITLSPGYNTVVVTGMRGGQTYTDTVVWHYTVPPTPGTGQIKVNFQPNDSGPTAAGYLIDTGLVFANRGNGASYGWNANNTANTRRRNVNSDPRFDTLIQMQANGTFTWEYALSAGTYDVSLFAGDPQYTDSIHSFKVEGVSVLDADGEDNFDSYAVRVGVTDGRLTIVPIGINAKIDFIEITPVTTTPPTVVSSQFINQATQSVQVQFNEPMDPASITTADLSVQASGGGPTYAPSMVAYDPTTWTATFTFPARLPPNGGYVATLPAGSVNEASGKSIASQYQFSFYDLLGDTNSDGTVNVADLANLAGNFGVTSGAGWLQGDFDYNGTVNVADLADLAGNFGVTLPPPSAPVSFPASPAAVGSTQPGISANPAAESAGDVLPLWLRPHRSLWSALPIQ
jgi:beta-galactosidase